jgi:hypothetical protein
MSARSWRNATASSASTSNRYFLVDNIPLPVKKVEIHSSDIENVLVEAGLFIPGGNAFARGGAQGTLARASNHQHPAILSVIENEVALASLGQHHIPLLDPYVEFIQLGVRAGQIVAKFKKCPQLPTYGAISVSSVLSISFSFWASSCNPVRSPLRISSSASAPLAFSNPSDPV